MCDLLADITIERGSDFWLAGFIVMAIGGIKIFIEELTKDQ
jgi:hypothetical protein